jgi:hypothetical protein
MEPRGRMPVSRRSRARGSTRQGRSRMRGKLSVPTEVGALPVAKSA